MQTSLHPKLAPCSPRVWGLTGFPLVVPPLTLDLGLLLISIGVVNLWKARRSDGRL